MTYEDLENDEEIAYDELLTSDVQWQSTKFRKWIRDNCECMQCGQPLINEKENYTTHHYKPKNFTSTGGTVNTRDQFLVCLCLFCHNMFHSLGAEKFMDLNGFSEGEFLENCTQNLIRYLAHNNNKNYIDEKNSDIISIINLLTSIVIAKEEMTAGS